MEEVNLREEGYEKPIDILHREVKNHRQYIDEEVKRGTGNTWPSRVMSRITAMIVSLDMAEEEREVSGEEYQTLMGKLRNAVSHAQAMQRKYPEIDSEIPEDEKETMLSMLDIFNT